MNIRKVSCVPIVKNNSNKILKLKNMPIVTTPLLAYYIGEYQDDNVDKILNFLRIKHIPIPSALTPHSLTKTGWDPASQTKVKNTLKNALDKNQITEDEYNKCISKINFTGTHDDIIQGDTFATMEPDHHDMGFGQISAGFGELQFPEGAEITEQLGHVADMLDNPVLEGVAAELLPGTKFLKPRKDLIDEDYEKAA